MTHIKIFANYLSLLAIASALILCFSPDASGQSYAWVTSAGGSGFDMGYDIQRDAAGNLYITGMFGSGSSDFGGVTLNGNGTQNLYVAKYDALTGSCLWAVKADGFIASTSLSLTPAGDIYVTGYLNGSNTFGTINATASGIYDVFTARLDNNGTWKWVTTAGGSGAGDQNYGNAVIADAAGCYITGTFIDTVSFGGTQLISSGGDDIFISRIDSSGAWQWTRQFGSAGNDDGNGLSSDGAGGLYCTGLFSDTVAFGAYSLISSGFEDIFVLRMDNAGTVQKVFRAGGTTPDFGHAVQPDNQGHLYVTGWYSTTAVFGSDSVTTSGGNEVFVARCDTAGNWQWASSGGTPGIDIAYDIAVDDRQNSYITGYVNSGYQVVFGPYADSLVSAFADMFIAKCDSSGNWQWMELTGGPGTDVGYGIVTDGCSIFTAGLFGNTVSFDTITLTTVASNDAYIARYADPANPCGIPLSAFQSSDTTSCGKTCIDFTNLSTGGATSWQWYFPGADSVFSSEQSPANICYNNYGSFDVTLISCNGAGCDTLTLPGFIQIFPDPIQPVVTASGDTLICSLSSPGYQWYLNNNPIAGATDSIYVMTQQGTYFVFVVDTNGCGASSNLILNTSVGEAPGEPALRIMPNPAHDYLDIVMEAESPLQLKLSLSDVEGRLLRQIYDGRAEKHFKIRMEVGNLEKGIYLLRMNGKVTRILVL